MLETDYGTPTPKGWIALAELLLDFASRSGVPDSDADICRAYYARYMLLRFDKSSNRRGVWRGPKFIPLDEQPFRLAEMIAQQKGLPISSEDLKRVAGSLNNVHMLARRVREAIEPDLSSPIYLKNRRDEGYWLENLARDPAV
jgi:hypothetical protein